MLRLLALDGLAGSGKDAIADGLVRSHGFTKVPFALPMKEMFARVFELPKYNFDVRALKDAPLSKPVVLTRDNLTKLLLELEQRGIEVPPEAYLRCFSFEGTVLDSPRKIMQIVATDVVRNCVDNLAWVKLWDDEQRKHEKVIAPDARFSDEKEYVRKIHGKVLLVKRSGVEAMAHVSENDKWPDDRYDAIISNDGGLQRIQSEVAMWYTVHK